MRLPKKQKKLNKASTHSVQQEQRVANVLNGYTTPASGAGNQKGDVRVKGKFRVECKATTKKEYLATLSVLDKIKQEALSFGETPVLQVDFLDEHTYSSFYLVEIAFIPCSIVDRYALTAEFITNRSSKTLKLTKPSTECAIIVFTFNGKLYYFFPESIIEKELAEWIQE